MVAQVWRQWLHSPVGPAVCEPVVGMYWPGRHVQAIVPAPSTTPWVNEHKSPGGMPQTRPFTLRKVAPVTVAVSATGCEPT